MIRSMGRRWAKNQGAKANLKFVIPSKAGIQNKRKIGLPKLVGSDKIEKIYRFDGMTIKIMKTNKLTQHLFLGAGLGTRLRPLTENTPKPLLEIGGRPIITYAMAHLRAVGVKRFIVNTHHCAEKYAGGFSGK